MSHNLNPFDFVYFSENKPVLKTREEWLGYNNLVTGYIVLKIKALYPIHIVGEQKAQTVGRNDFKINQSLFNRRLNRPNIPSSTIRGVLRSFLETLCNGWASQLTPLYKKEFKKHTTGFRAIGPPDEIRKSRETREIDANLPLSLPEQFTPKIDDTGKMDVCSFLFGHVLEEGNSNRGRIIIEDVFIDPETLDGNNYHLPDIKDSAFMGGPKPSASSWWYQKPFEIRLKRTKFGDSPQFVGSGFWGRKFYYHQNPVNCINFYKDPLKWQTRSDHPVYTFPVEIIQPENETETFRLQFENVPRILLDLLLLALFPGDKIRHKIGYGKAYGFGSFEFKYISNDLRKKTNNEKIEFENDIKTLISSNWDKTTLDKFGAFNFIDQASLGALYRILYFDPSSQIIFTYPPFGKGGFLPSVVKRDLENMLDRKDFYVLTSSKRLSVGLTQAKKIAKEIYNIRKRQALHFEIYRENSSGFKEISSRKLVCV